MLVRLIYFKASGKYYSEGSYQTSHKHAFEIYREIEWMRKTRKLPGLASGHWEFGILVELKETSPMYGFIYPEDYVPEE